MLEFEYFAFSVEAVYEEHGSCNEPAVVDLGNQPVITEASFVVNYALADCVFGVIAGLDVILVAYELALELLGF